MKRIGSIHYARFEDSDRLQRLLDLMLDGKPRTTREVSRGAEIEAVNSAACELRLNGFDLACIRKCKPAVYQLFNVEAAHSEAVMRLARHRIKEAA